VCSSLRIHSTKAVNQAYYVEILKPLLEAVHRNMPEFWPNDWILHHDNASPHKEFLAQKSITEMEHLFYSLDLAPNDSWLFPKIQSALRDEDLRILKFPTVG
jgi:hypothetical protein